MWRRQRHARQQSLLDLEAHVIGLQTLQHQLLREQDFARRENLQLRALLSKANLLPPEARISSRDSPVAVVSIWTDPMRRQKAEVRVRESDDVDDLVCSFSLAHNLDVTQADAIKADLVRGLQQLRAASASEDSVAHEALASSSATAASTAGWQCEKAVSFSADARSFLEDVDGGGFGCEPSAADGSPSSFVRDFDGLFEARWEAASEMAMEAARFEAPSTYRSSGVCPALQGETGMPRSAARSTSQDNGTLNFSEHVSGRALSPWPHEVGWQAEDSLGSAGGITVGELSESFASPCARVRGAHTHKAAVSCGVAFGGAFGCMSTLPPSTPGRQPRQVTRREPAEVPARTPEASEGECGSRGAAAVAASRRGAAALTQKACGPPCTPSLASAAAVSAAVDAAKAAASAAAVALMPAEAVNGRAVALCDSAVSSETSSGAADAIASASTAKEASFVKHIYIPKLTKALGMVLQRRENKLYVQRLLHAGAAAEAGLAVNDLLLEVNGSAVTTSAQVRALLDPHAPIFIVVLRAVSCPSEQRLPPLSSRASPASFMAHSAPTDRKGRALSRAHHAAVVALLQRALDDARVEGADDDEALRGGEDERRSKALQRQRCCSAGHSPGEAGVHVEALAVRRLLHAAAAQLSAVDADKDAARRETQLLRQQRDELAAALAAAQSRAQQRDPAQRDTLNSEVAAHEAICGFPPGPAAEVEREDANAQPKRAQREDVRNVSTETELWYGGLGHALVAKNANVSLIQSETAGGDPGLLKSAPLLEVQLVEARSELERVRTLARELKQHRDEARSEAARLRTQLAAASAQQNGK